VLADDGDQQLARVSVFSPRYRFAIKLARYPSLN